MTYVYKIIRSPIGNLKLIASDKGLAAILWENDSPERIRLLSPMLEKQEQAVLLATKKQLEEYFSKQRQSFTIPQDFMGTDFQKKVWQALLTIPFGKTRSYGQIAKQIGYPKAARAVGNAIRKNPLSIIIPCHRVIGSTGRLVGFAGGLETKEFLLSLEVALKYK